jgi:hypothetical protein
MTWPKVFTLTVVLDATYQLIVQRGVYVLELVIVATSLAVVPYVLLRYGLAHCKVAGSRARVGKSRPSDSPKEPLQGEHRGKA